MRHGQSEANVEGIIVSDPARGIERYGLTDAGKEQAKQSITRSALVPDQIISSDFKRAKQTAEIAAAITGAHLVFDSRLRERFFGAYNGLSDTNYEAVWQKDALNEDPGQNVERPGHVLARALAVIEEFELTAAPAAEARARQTVLLVAHGDVCQILLAWAANKEPSEHRSAVHMQTAEIRRLNLLSVEGV